MSQSHALYLTADLRHIEQAALAQLPPGTLMQRAADAVAGMALQLLGGRAARARVLVLAGPGNNGGDALLAAVALQRAGALPSVMLCPEQATRPDDAQRAYDAALNAGIPIVAATPTAMAAGDWQLVLDGLFGIGLSRALPDAALHVIAALRTLRCPVLAIDIPSGLNADTGMTATPDGTAVRATHTITFIADKPGLHTGRGRDHAGQVTVDTLAIPAGCYTPAALHLGHPSMFADVLTPRPHFSHKGSYGDLTLIGGAPGMGGALILSSRAALYAGAGRIFAGFLDAPPAYDERQPELMCRRAADMDLSSGAVVIGPGLGRSPAAAEILARLLTAPVSAVIDADALNLLAADETLRVALAARQAPTVLTPHPLEAARMLACDTADVQADRIGAARLLARRSNAVVVLKGSGSVVASGDGRAAINPTGNPGLATGGTGDVLAGLCGALLARGIPPWQASVAAVWLHGCAADDLVRAGAGPVGLTASELAPAIRAVLNRMVNQQTD